MNKRETQQWIKGEEHTDLENLGNDSELKKNSHSLSEQEKIGDPESSLRKAAQRQRWKIIAILMFLAIIIWLLGRLQKDNLLLLLKPKLSIFKKLDLIESRNGVVLMMERQPKMSTIYVELSGEVGWRNLSKSDFTVSNPALSNDGRKVAYLSNNEFTHIVIISLNSDSMRLITTKSIHNKLLSKSLELEKSSICNWTKIRWSRDDTHIAFFANNADSLKSFAAVVRLTYDAPKIVWFENEVEIYNDRDLIWLDSTTLILSSFDSINNSYKVKTVKIN